SMMATQLAFFLSSSCGSVVRSGMVKAPVFDLSITAFAGGIREPRQEPIQRPAVHDALGWNTGKPRMRDRGLGIGELCRGVRIAVEREEASCGERTPCQHVVQILAGGIAVNLDGHTACGSHLEYRLPIRQDACARAGDATA